MPASESTPRPSEPAATATRATTSSPTCSSRSPARAAAAALAMTAIGSMALKFPPPRTNTGLRRVVPLRNRPMDRGLYIAASGMLAELVRQDQLANDLANASTPGYKADRAAEASFGQLLLRNRTTGEPIGSLGFGAQIAEIRTDLTQGPLRQTDEPLDVAL